MHAYIIRRLLMGLLIIWGVYTITFLAVNLAPGQTLTLWVSREGATYIGNTSPNVPNFSSPARNQGEIAGS